jgi:mannose-1-phosphate guanylyltransferase
MAGGIGSRFWPMSRTEKPKQFLDILGTGKTLLQMTYERFLPICPKENIYIVANKDYEHLIKEQLPEINPNTLILEPLRKNTAPCVAYASYKIAAINPKANICVAPSDHLILKEDTFVKAIKSCFKKTKKYDCLMTIGIKPTRPDTGYGYIQFTDSDVPETDSRIKKVKTFTEKPNLEMAQFFLESGDFLWNAGIFVWNVQSILKALDTYLPEINNIFKEGITIYNTPLEKNFIDEAYIQCKNISIDYGVMEKAKNVYVRASIIGWSDLGTWGSLYTHIKHDSNENAVVGKNVMLYNSNSNIIHVPKDKLVVLDGLNDYIVVESDGILLICPKQNEQHIRQIVTDVKTQKGDKFV